jgi:hypothetical protein
MQTEYDNLIRTERLPTELRRLVREQDAWTVAERTAELLEQRKDADLLVAHVVALFVDTVEIMVDAVEERFPEMLDLLSEAVKLGYPASDLRKLRGRIRRILKKQRERRAEVLALLDEDPETLDIRSVTSLAYELGQKPTTAHHAGELYYLAADRYDAENAPPYQINDNRARGALAFAKAKKWDRCLEHLETLVSDTPIGVADWAVGFAFAHLIDHELEQDDYEAATVWFDRAVQWAQDADRSTDYFPVARPRQDQYLRLFLQHDDTARLAVIVDVMQEERTSRNMTEEVAELLATAEQRLQ